MAWTICKVDRAETVALATELKDHTNVMCIHTTSASCSRCDDHHGCKCSICPSWCMEGKTPPVQVPQCHLEHTYIGARCSNQMQLAHGHHLNADFALVQPAFGVLCFVLFVICNCLCFICYLSNTICRNMLKYYLLVMQTLGYHSCFLHKGTQCNRKQVQICTICTRNSYKSPQV